MFDDQHIPNLSSYLFSTPTFILGRKSNLELEKYYFYKGTQSANGIDSYTYPSFDSPPSLSTPPQKDKKDSYEISPI